MDRKNFVFLGIALLVLAVLAYVFWPQTTSYLPPKKITKASIEKIPGTIVHIRWSIAGEDKIFVRAKLNAPWLPPRQNNTNLELLEKVLPLIPPQAAPFEIFPIPKKPLVEVAVSFDNLDEEWVGGFDGTNFVWSAGDLKGYGKKLEAHEIALFNSGRFAFDNKRIDWCASRLKAFEKKGSYEFKYVGNKWTYSSIEDHKNAKPINANLFESWIGKNCTLLVDQFIDPKLAATFYLADETFNATFERSVLKIKVGQDNVVSLGDRYFTSDAFFKALQSPNGP